MTVIPAPPSGVASIDFEVYSEAGYFLDFQDKWRATVKGKPGLPAIGAYNYAIHESTRVLSLAYDLHDGHGIRLWYPGIPEPDDLLRHTRNFGMVEAHNSIFEFWIWNHVMTCWPPLHLEQMTCTMSRCAAFGLPRALGKVHYAIDLPVHKQDIGKELIKEFCVPHNRKKKKYTIGQLHSYCIDDVRVEDALSLRLPELSARERRVWLLDQHINNRGVQIDVNAAKALAFRVDKYVRQAGDDISSYTNGAATSPIQVAKIGKWLERRGLKLERTPKGSYKLDKDAVEKLFIQVDDEDSPEWNVLDLRQQYSLASVNKIKTMCHMVSPEGRLRGLFSFCGAHTLRWVSTGVQLQNLPRGSMTPEDVDRVIDEIKCNNWSSVEGENPLTTISSLVRGLFIAAPGHDLLCADFSAIEGRGAAMLSGEEWRKNVFNTHGKIYEQTAADVSGASFEDILRYREEQGKYHPIRGLGKTAELASQYQGWIDAWLRFGAGRYFDSREDIKKAILAWRAASPAIIEMWGGQLRKHPQRWEWTRELYGLEGAVVRALSYPNEWFQFRGVYFKHDTVNDTLICQMPSGRQLWYRQPRMYEKWNPYAEMKVWRITYRGWSDSSGWHMKDMFGGRFFENIVQSECRNIMADTLLRLDPKYPVVIHVHDEPVMEVPKGTGSLKEVVSLMEQREPWYADWPIRAGGEWRGHRFRK